MKIKNKSGFTLLEIVVVLIIVGILAAIALPNLFSWIQKSTAAEGLLGAGNFKDQIEACIQIHPGNETACNATLYQSPNFAYGFSVALVNGSGGGNYSLWTGNESSGSYIYLTKSTASGTFTCYGTSQFAGIC